LPCDQVTPRAAPVLDGDEAARKTKVAYTRDRSVNMQSPPPRLRRHRRLTSVSAALLILTAAAAVNAQAPVPMVPALQEPTRRLWALDLDGGASRDLGPSGGWRAFGRIGAGLGWFDGQRLLGATLALGGHRSSRATLGLGGQIASVQSGLGATATVMRDLTHGGFGAAVGGSFSLLNVQAQIFQNGPSTRAVTIFLRAPLGLLLHIWRSRPR
jgi:hypothetical protein